MGTWNDTLKIGVPLIDLQHKQLLDQMDLLVEALRAKKDAKQLLSIMKFLDMYVANHFGYEEQCMHINKCSAGGQNKTAHAYFVARLKEINTDLASQKSLELTANRVSHELLQWFVNHIRSIDSQLGRCVQKP
jgi:hemerythrin